jgi:lipoyl(octanoyl) transferase
LEETLRLLLDDLGIQAFTVPDYTGVWVGNADVAGDPAARARGEVRKIASIGVHVSRWVTWHGFALNLTPAALAGFDWIVPCGIDQVRMTCVEEEGGKSSPEVIRTALVSAFSRSFETDAFLAPEIEPGAHPILPEAVT